MVLEMIKFQYIKYGFLDLLELTRNSFCEFCEGCQKGQRFFAVQERPTSVSLVGYQVNESVRHWQECLFHQWLC
jgi:hypothetical protein